MRTAYLQAQLVALSLILGAFFLGWPQAIWHADATHISAGIAAITVAASISAGFARTREWLPWVVDNGVTLLLGLLGTVLGFMAAVQGMASADVAAKMGGVSTSNATTVAGLVCHLYLLVLARVVR